MSIHKYLEKIKGGLEVGDIAFVFIVILVGTASFGLGRLSVQPRENDEMSNKVVIVEAPSTGSEEDTLTRVNTDIDEGKYVASRNGTKYYTEDCSGANSINEENKIWFRSGEEAELAGYEKSSTCQY